MKGFKTLGSLIGLLFLLISPTASLKAQTPVVTIESHGFNAKKRSGFQIGKQVEKVERGLTLLHFQAKNQHEFKSFDTYGSEEDLSALLKTLDQLVQAKAVFALLAHDSAVKGSLTKAQELAALGFVKLSALKSREAYIAFSVDGVLQEFVDPVSLEQTFSSIKTITDTTVYFPKITYEFEPNTNRYIAHAGGEINEIKSTNSKEALDENYKKGFRLFELDIIKTADGKLVAAHDWKMWARFTDYTGSLPPSHKEFLKRKIYGDYTTLDMNGINAWFKAHPDAILITDKLNDPIQFADKFVDKNRLIMELFSIMSIDEASRHGIQPMISQEPLLKLKGDKINFLKINNVKYAAVSRRIISSQTKLLQLLRENGIKVYVYNVNFDPGKDETYVLENEIGLVYGMYADKWVFDGK